VGRVEEEARLEEGGGGEVGSSLVDMDLEGLVGRSPKESKL